MSRKRLVICCDGTWNTPDETNEGQSTPTNVTKVALCVAPQRRHFATGCATP
jgi:uncharacterized protein (DUF2235 family)